MSNPTHGLCKECLTKTNWDQIKNENSILLCSMCQKQPNVLYNQEPYCTTCYLLTISSPMKSQVSSNQTIMKQKCFSKLIDKSEYLKKSFLSSSGKLIRKIQKLFDETQKDSNLQGYLSKKCLLGGPCNWDKMVSKVNKASSVIYFFFNRTHILGAFHVEPVNIDGEGWVSDEESGIFMSQINSFNPEFSRVKSNMVMYSKKSHKIRFGEPSSFEISFQKAIKVNSELINNFEWMNFYVYRP